MYYVRSATLTAGAVTTFTVNAADNTSQLEIVNVTGAAPIYFVVGDTVNPPANPTVAGADCDVVAGVAGATVPVRRVGTTNTLQVKVISSGTPGVAIRATG